MGYCYTYHMEETTLPQPESMDDLMYFTRRTVFDGRVVAWVFKPECPACGEAQMRKPRNKDGKPKTRSKTYVCPACEHEEKKSDVKANATVNVHYICPHCEHEGDATTDYKRRTYMGKKSFVFQCAECWQEIPITKRVKQPKKLKTKKNPKPPEDV